MGHITLSDIYDLTNLWMFYFTMFAFCDNYTSKYYVQIPFYVIIEVNFPSKKKQNMAFA